MANRFAAIGAFLYNYHYNLGLQTAHIFQRFGWWLYRVTRPQRRLCRYLWLRRVVLPAHRFRRKLRNLFGQLGPAFRFMKRTAKEKKNPLAVVPCFLRLCRSAVRHYWEELASLGRILGPVAAIAVLIVTIGAWNGTEYYLNVEYKNESIGVVANADVYEAGAEMAKERVINATNDFKVDVPVFTMTMQEHKTPLTEEEVCDAILRASRQDLAEVTGLYINDQFIGAMETEEEIDTLLKAYKDNLLKELPKEEDAEQQKVKKVEFTQTIEKIPGLYPIATLCDKEMLEAEINGKHILQEGETLSAIVARYELENLATLLKLNPDYLDYVGVETLTLTPGESLQVPDGTHTVLEGETLASIAGMHQLEGVEALLKLNPDYVGKQPLTPGEEIKTQKSKHLSIKVIKTYVKTEVIDYKTTTKYRDDMYEDEKRVAVEGKEGEREITTEETWIDGKLSKSRVVKRTTTKKAVNKVIEKGTKKRVIIDGVQVDQGDGIAHGNMQWPVPICHSMSRGYTSGHKAIDICNGPVPVYGHPAVAADGGKVLHAGWYYDYGLHVRIDHGNGIVTTYSHLSAVKVKAGQLVTRGQTVGLIGNTGWSEGPHLHFEVVVNGTRVDPLRYVSP